jgi:selenide,water dikinase
MAERAGAFFAFEAAALPLYDGALDALRRGVRTGGDPRNRDYAAHRVVVDAAVDPDLAAIGFDPQTSGGLLAAVDASAVDALNTAGFVRIGTVVAGDPSIALR